MIFLVVLDIIGVIECGKQMQFEPYISCFAVCELWCVLQNLMSNLGGVVPVCVDIYSIYGCWVRLLGLFLTDYFVKFVKCLFLQHRFI